MSDHWRSSGGTSSTRRRTPPRRRPSRSSSPSRKKRAHSRSRSRSRSRSPPSSRRAPNQINERARGGRRSPPPPPPPPPPRNLVSSSQQQRSPKRSRSHDHDHDHDHDPSYKLKGETRSSSVELEPKPELTKADLDDGTSELKAVPQGIPPGWERLAEGSTEGTTPQYIHRLEPGLAPQADPWAFEAARAKLRPHSDNLLDAEISKAKGSSLTDNLANTIKGLMTTRGTSSTSPAPVVLAPLDREGLKGVLKALLSVRQTLMFGKGSKVGRTWDVCALPELYVPSVSPSTSSSSSSSFVLGLSLTLLSVPSEERVRNKFWELKRTTQPPSKRSLQVLESTRLAEVLSSVTKALLRQNEVSMYGIGASAVLERMVWASALARAQVRADSALQKELTLWVYRRSADSRTYFECELTKVSVEEIPQIRSLSTTPTPTNNNNSNNNNDNTRSGSGSGSGSGTTLHKSWYSSSSVVPPNTYPRPPPPPPPPLPFPSRGGLLVSFPPPQPQPQPQPPQRGSMTSYAYEPQTTYAAAMGSFCPPPPPTAIPSAGYPAYPFPTSPFAPAPFSMPPR